MPFVRITTLVHVRDGASVPSEKELEDFFARVGGVVSVKVSTYDSAMFALVGSALDSVKTKKKKR